MMYVVQVGDDLWFAGVEDGHFHVTADLDEAVIYTDPVAAARAVGRVSVEAPLLDPHGAGRLNMPLLLAGARVQRLEAREPR